MTKKRSARPNTKEKKGTQSKEREDRGKKGKKNLKGGYLFHRKGENAIGQSVPSEGKPSVREGRISRGGKRDWNLGGFKKTKAQEKKRDHQKGKGGDRVRWSRPRRKLDKGRGRKRNVQQRGGDRVIYS